MVRHYDGDVGCNGSRAQGHLTVWRRLRWEALAKKRQGLSISGKENSLHKDLPTKERTHPVVQHGYGLKG